MAAEVRIDIVTHSDLKDKLGGMRQSFTEFSSALSLVKQGAEMVGRALDATVGVTGKYADQVRLLSSVSGQSTENTSRFIQVLDDYKISAEEAERATKALTKNGMAPTIDTLAKLSDQYIKLGSAEEKNAFVLKNLGKSGLDWVEILGKGSAAIKEQGAAVAHGLILTQQEVDAARRLQIAQDSLNDARQAAATQLGNVLIPVETDFLNGVNVTIRAIDIMKEKMGTGALSSNIFKAFGQASDEAGQAISQEQEAMLKTQQAAQGMGDAINDTVDPQKAAADAAKGLSNELTSTLSAMFTIQKTNESYAKTVGDLAAKDQDLVEQKQRLTYEWYQSQKAGKDTTKAFEEYTQKLSDVQKAEASNAESRKTADEDLAKSSKQRQYDLVAQKLAADGVTSSKEYDYLQNLAVSYDLVSRASADSSISENKRADALVSGFEQTLPLEERSLQVMQQIAAFNGTVVDFGVNFHSNAPVSMGQGGNGNNGSNYSQSFGSGQSSPMKVPAGSRDSGGSGVAGQSYLIGRGAQPELFTPSTNGTFTPANQQGKGTTYNITINNPQPEKSENSIRVALKKLSYVGVAQ